MIRILTIAAAGLAGASIAAVAVAHPGHDGAQGGPPMMLMLQHHLDGMDANKDGFITKDEFLSHPASMFDRLDANHDGRISKDELAAMKAMHGEHRVCKIQKDGDKEPHDVPCDSMPGMAGEPGGHMAMMMHHMAANMDADHDGRISFSEFQAPVHDHFNKLDKNGDGYISKDEMPDMGAMVIEQHIEKKD